MCELTSQELLSKSLELARQELQSLTREREAVTAEYRARLDPLERQIASLESVVAHQLKAQQAFGTGIGRHGVDSGTVSAQPNPSAGGAKFTDVIEQILVEESKPTHYTTLASKAIQRGVAITAKDPGAFVINYLRREPDRFCRAATAGEYGLLIWNLPGAKRLDEPKRTAVKTKRTVHGKSRGAK